jgi:hypothetical protein
MAGRKIAVMGGGGCKTSNYKIQVAGHESQRTTSNNRGRKNNFRYHLTAKFSANRLSMQPSTRLWVDIGDPADTRRSSE